MNRSNAKTGNRRDFLRAAAAVAATMALTSVPRAGRAASKRDTGRMKIGVIGSGRIGGTLGTLWVKADADYVFDGADQPSYSAGEQLMKDTGGGTVGSNNWCVIRGYTGSPGSEVDANDNSFVSQSFNRSGQR